MQILKIGYNNNLNQHKYNKSTKYHTPSINYQNNIQYNIPFMAVSKEMPRFYYFIKDKMPTTVRDFLDKQPDKFLLKPQDAHKLAFKDLAIAKSIEDIQQKLFPNEELFYYLVSLEEAQDSDGLLGIYKEYKELYPNGILKNGEDFTLYLVNKLFGKAKLIQEVNEDLEKDLNEDIKAEFKRRCPKSDYVQSKTLKSLGINLPDTAYLNSLKFTRDGYAAAFGLIISDALQRKLDGMTEEEKQQQFEGKNGNREHWWNSLTREQKLELIAKIDEEQQDVYKQYKEFEKENKTPKKEAIRPEFLREKSKKKQSGTKISDKDLFVIWMKKKLDKAYSELSEAELDAIHIKRSKRQAQRWQEMSPIERTEYINKIRTGMEPLKYAMIDAWNHSRILIRVLSEFLKEHQIFKPVDVIYSDSEFKEFQSKIMTEFWSENKDLAEDFGKKIAYSHTKVEDAIKNGTFEELKKIIETERDERKRILAEEFQSEVEETKQIDAEKKEEVIKPKASTLKIDNLRYQKEFYVEYTRIANRWSFLPFNYIRELSDIILQTYPKEFIEEFLSGDTPKEDIVNEINKTLSEKCSKENLQKLNRIQHALETALAKELVSKGGDAELYEKSANELIYLLNELAPNINLKKQSKINKYNILQSYNEYKKNIKPTDLVYIVNSYFTSISPTESHTKEDDKILMDYLNDYGRTLLILFDKNTTIPVNVKVAFNNKFLRLMPADVKNVVKPLIKTEKDIKDNFQIDMINRRLAKRFDYIPNDPLNSYTNEAATIMRLSRLPDAAAELRENYNMNSIKESLYEKTESNELASILRIPKHYISLNVSKLKLLAIEQAMADELYRVSKNNIVYKFEFEDLALWFELSKNLPKGSNDGLELSNEDTGESFIIKERPDFKNLILKYVKYIREFDASGEDLYKDGKLNREEILYCLNPNENMQERDKYTKERINLYVKD